MRLLLASLFCFYVFGFEHFIHDETGVRFEVTEENRKSYEEFLTKFSQLSRRKLISTSNEDLEDREKEILLDFHNNYRNITAQGNTPGEPAATNMHRLLWDEALAVVARNYAEECIWEHNPNRDTETVENAEYATFYISSSASSVSVGENLYAVSTGVTSINALVSGIYGWYEEYQYYTFDTDACQANEQCGHYTQVVWDNTRYVGCAYYYCDSGLTGIDDWSEGTILVCNYYPAGNYPRSPYTEADSSADVCTECDTDRTYCTDGLCDGCPNPEYPDLPCDDIYSNCASFSSSCESGCTFGSEEFVSGATCYDCAVTCETCENTDDSVFIYSSKSCDNGAGTTWYTCENEGSGCVGTGGSYFNDSISGSDGGDNDDDAAHRFNIVPTVFIVLLSVFIVYR